MSLENLENLSIKYFGHLTFYFLFDSYSKDSYSGVVMMWFYLLKFSLLVTLSMAFTLDSSDYDHCYMEYQSSTSNILTTFDVNGDVFDDLYSNKCFRLNKNEPLKRTESFIDNAPLGIRKQCMFYEFYKYTNDIPSIFDLNDCSFCFLFLDHIRYRGEYDLVTSDKCGNLSDHLILVQNNGLIKEITSNDNMGGKFTLNIKTNSTDFYMTYQSYEFESLIRYGKEFKIIIPFTEVLPPERSYTLEIILFTIYFIIILITICAMVYLFGNNKRCLD